MSVSQSPSTTQSFSRATSVSERGRTDAGLRSSGSDDSRPRPVTAAGNGHSSTEHRSTEAAEAFEKDVIDGLCSRSKSLPCKYFYDQRGSELFEQICETEEYYVTRTELALLKEVCPYVARAIGPFADVLEPGSGAGEKIRTLLDALDRPRSFIPIDISKTAVARSAQALSADYPDLELIPLVADFTQPFTLPANFLQKSAHRKVVFFPGSTISNFSPNDARQFLVTLKGVLNRGDYLFIGVDRIKDRAILERAYDDASGITAAFNLNLLVRIKNELDTDLDPRTFAHRALYNEAQSRIEMHLVSKTQQAVRINDIQIPFGEGERIHTENSYKYSVPGFTRLARDAGFRVERTFSDEGNLFSLYLCQVP